MTRPPRFRSLLPTDYCPFQDETDRPPEKRYPCPERYRATCGCKRDGIPQLRPRWKRHAT